MSPFLIDQKAYLSQSELFPAPYSRAEFLVIRSGISFLSRTAFKLPYPVSCKYFSYYKLLYWTGSYTLESIEAGIIVRDGIAFRVHFHGTNRGSILAYPNDQYALSFRAPNSEFDLDPIVLISHTDKKVKP